MTLRTEVSHLEVVGFVQLQYGQILHSNVVHKKYILGYRTNTGQVEPSCFISQPVLMFQHSGTNCGFVLYGEQEQDAGASLSIWTYLQTGYSYPHSTNDQQVVCQKLLQLSDASSLHGQMIKTS